MKKKYYYVSSLYRYYDLPYKPQATVLEDKHPFEWMADLNKKVPNSETVIITWKEISKEEFDLYKKLKTAHKTGIIKWFQVNE